MRPKRIKGALPEGTAVLHKPGTSGSQNGNAPATNDVGLIVLLGGLRGRPRTGNGQKTRAVAVFLTDSKADDATRDAVIARITRAIYDSATASGRE